MDGASATAETDEPQARSRLFEGIHNFRDFGGYPVAGGGRLKRGLLFRSGEHFRATAADLEAIADLGLATVVDLRDPSERAASPCARHEGFSARMVMVEQDREALAPHLIAARIGGDREGARAEMIRIYRGLPFRERMIPALRGFFAALEELDRPLLIHCMAGKDRTGMAVALFHAAIGVSREDLYDDYLATNRAHGVEGWLAAAVDRFRGKLGESITEEVVREMMGVDPAYLDAGFAAIDERHGSLDAYLTDVLGVDSGARERLRARLVVR